MQVNSWSQFQWSERNCKQFHNNQQFGLPGVFEGSDESHDLNTDSTGIAIWSSKHQKKQWFKFMSIYLHILHVFIYIISLEPSFYLL